MRYSDDPEHGAGAQSQRWASHKASAKCTPAPPGWSSQSWEQGLGQVLLPSRVRGDSYSLFSEGPYLSFSGT